LLQVGVQSQHLAQPQRGPIHLVLAADTSAAMRWGGRLDMLRRALGGLARRLGPADRLSLIAFSDEARVLVRDVGPGEADQFAAAARSLAAEGSSNLAAGLSKAYLVAGQEAAANHAAVRVVLLTDNGLDLSPETARHLAQGLAQTAGRGAGLHIIDLSQQPQGDPRLTSFAAAAHGAVHHAGNADQIGWALSEVLSGQSQVVACDARLRVTFNPAVVLEYRLLGHEAKALAGLMPEHPQADFHDGQSATALYELRLAPGAGADLAAVADLTWYEPGSDGRPAGRPQRRLQQGISPPQFAASFMRTAPSLQEAAMAALAAEALRKSPFLRTPRTAAGQRNSTALVLKNVREMSGEVDSRLWQRPAFLDFLALVDQAIKAAPARPGPTRRPAYAK
jgi:Ca-activated chloride channel family protein